MKEAAQHFASEYKNGKMMSHRVTEGTPHVKLPSYHI